MIAAPVAAARNSNTVASLGTDPFTEDGADPRQPTVFSQAGASGITLGFNADAVPDTIWIVKRSFDLTPGSFEEIYRYDGSTGVATADEDFDVEYPAGRIRLIDNRAPRPAAAFYRVEAVVAP